MVAWGGGSDGRKGNRESGQDHNCSGGESAHLHHLLTRRQPSGGVGLDAKLAAELQPRLLRSLLRRGRVTYDMAWDALQEAQAAMLERNPRLESREAVYRWLNITAHRRVTRWLASREQPSPDVEVLYETPSSDMATEVETRFVLRATREVWPSLRPKDREVLGLVLNDGDLGPTKRARDRISLRASRARDRLRARLREWLPVVVLGRSRSRRVAMPSPSPAATALAAAFTAALIGAGILGSSPTEGLQVKSESRISADPGEGAERQTPPANDDKAASNELPRSRPAAPTPKNDPADGGGPLSRRIEIPTPATHGPIEVETRPRAPGDDSLACWANWPVVPSGCVRHPLRP